MMRNVFKDNGRSIAVCAILFGLMLGACGGGRILIKGRVVDDTGAPLNQATVQTRPDTDVVYTQRSGHFVLRQRINALGELEEIPPGRYTISITLNAYESFSREINAEGGEIDLGPIQMKERRAHVGEGDAEKSDDPDRKGGSGVKIGQ